MPPPLPPAAGCCRRGRCNRHTSGHRPQLATEGEQAGQTKTGLPPRMTRVPPRVCDPTGCPRRGQARRRRGLHRSLARHPPGPRRGRPARSGARPRLSRGRRRSARRRRGRPPVRPRKRPGRRSPSWSASATPCWRTSPGYAVSSRRCCRVRPRGSPRLRRGPLRVARTRCRTVLDTLAEDVDALGGALADPRVLSGAVRPTMADPRRGRTRRR